VCVGAVQWSALQEAAVSPHASVILLWLICKGL